MCFPDSVYLQVLYNYNLMTHKDTREVTFQKEIMQLYFYTLSLRKSIRMVYPSYTDAAIYNFDVRDFRCQ